MEVLTLEPNQYSQWNTFVDQSPQGDIFCYSWWLEAITKSNFKILAIYNNNEIIAGIPLALDAQGRVNIPPLTRTLGVLYKMQDYESERRKISAERKWLSELLKNISLNDVVQMCMHHTFNDWLPFRWNGFSQTTRYTYILNYENKTANELWINLDLRNRKIIKKSATYGIKIEITDDFDLIYHYESLSYERQGLKFEIPYSDLKFLDDAIRERGNRLIFKATDNSNKVHAVLYVAFNKKSAYALLSGSDPELRNMGGHTLILWEAVRYFSERVAYFNFGGSDIEKIESHLKGFGGTLTPYFHIYNDQFMWKRDDIRYHLGETSFHLQEAYKIVKNKILKTIRKK